MLSCEYLVIGAGQTGLIICQALVKTGKSVILVDQHQLGGSFLFTKEYPKFLLREAATKFAHSLENFKDFPETFPVLIKHRETIHDLIGQAIQQKTQEIQSFFQGFSNFRFLQGTAEFISKSLVEVNSTSEKNIVNFKQCVLAVGKDQLVKPEIAGIETIDFLYQENCFLFKLVPKRMAFTELTLETLEVAAIYADLGVKVGILDKHKNVQEALPNLDQSVINFFLKKLAAQEVDLIFNFDTKEFKFNRKKELVLKDKEGKKLIFPEVYLSIPTAFSGKSLGLNKIGIKADKRGIVTDSLGKTIHGHIYALGDCSNQTRPETKEFMIQEYIKNQTDKPHLMQILVPKKVGLADQYYFLNSRFPICSIGLSQHIAAQKYGNSVKTLVIRDNYTDSFVKVVYRDITGQVLGASSAGRLCLPTKDLLVEAIQSNWRYQDLAFKLEVYTRLS